MSESNTSVKVFKYRLYPSAGQEQNLGRVLEACRHLYNTALAERKYCAGRKPHPKVKMVHWQAILLE